MRYFIIHLFLFTSVIFSQHHFNFNKISLIKAIDDISDRTGYSIVFSSNQLTGIEVSGEYNGSINVILKSLFKYKAFEASQVNQSRFIVQKRKKVTLSGTVVSHLGEAMPYATIHSEKTKTTTDKNGRFVLHNITLPFQFEISHISSYSTKINVTLKEHLHLGKIKLKQNSYLSEDVHVMVSNEIIETNTIPGHISFSTKNFSNLPQLGNNDLFRSIQTLPGISSSSSEGSSINIRGGLASENLVLLDGMTLYHVDHAFGFFSAFNSSAIKNVELYKSGFPARYGNRTSGVLDLTSVQGNFTTPSFNSVINPLDAGISLSLPIFKNASLAVSARKSYTDYVLNYFYDNVHKSKFNSPIDKGEEETNPDIYYFDLLTKLTLVPSKTDIVSFSSYYGKDRFQHTTKYQYFDEDDRLHFDEPQLGSNRLLEWGNVGNTLKWDKEWSMTISTLLQISYSSYFSDFNSFDRFYFIENDSIENDDFKNIIDNTLDDFSFKFHSKLYANQSHTIEFGYNYTQLKISYNEQSDYTHKQSEKTNKHSIFFEDNWRISNNIQLTIGNRYTTNELTKSSIFEPRLSTQWNVSSSFSLKGAYGKFNQFLMPSPAKLNYLEGEFSWLLSESKHQIGKSEHFTFGLNYASQTTELDIESFYKTRDQFPYRISHSENVDEEIRNVRINGSIIGIDVLYKYKFNSYHGWLSYTFSEAVGEYSPGNITIKTKLNQDIPHSIKFVQTYHYSNWVFSSIWSYRSGRPYSIPELNQEVSEENQTEYNLHPPEKINTHRTSPVHQLHLSAKYNFSYELFSGSITASVYNVYNKKNIWYRYFNHDNTQIYSENIYQLGIHPSLSLQLTF